MAAAAAIAARARGAVLGCLVGDAAATPVHWVYDAQKLASHFQTAKRGPAFCLPAANGFYTTAPGALSCYGDQTLCLLESLVAKQGRLDVDDYAARLEEKFGKNSRYELGAEDPHNWPSLKENPKDSKGNVITEQRLWNLPLPGPWRHGSMKGFLKNYVNEGKRPPVCGGNDEQVDGCCKVPPLVARFAGDADLLTFVDRAVRVTQDTDLAVSYACGFARVLEKLVLGTASTVESAIALAEAELNAPERRFKTPLDAEVAANLARVMAEFAGVEHAEAGRRLRPEGKFEFAGLS